MCEMGLKVSGQTGKERLRVLQKLDCILIDIKRNTVSIPFE